MSQITTKQGQQDLERLFRFMLDEQKREEACSEFHRAVKHNLLRYSNASFLSLAFIRSKNAHLEDLNKI